jgi:hypothetical protein
MKFFVSTLLVTNCFFLFSQKQLNIVFFVNDSKTSSSELNSFSNMVYLNNGDVKLANYTIYHFTSKKERDTTWTNKKKNASYKVIQTDCDFSICSSLNTLVPDKKTQKNKFYNCQNLLKCDFNKWNISNVNTLTSRSESLLLEKIKEEVSLNKIDKTNTTIFFYLGNDMATDSKPEIKFEKETISVKSGESVQLNPVFSKNIKNVVWTPNENISCIDCKTPTVNPSKNAVYTVSASDSMNCHNVSKSITVNVINDCDCNSGSMKPINDVFGKLTVSKYKNDIDIAEWQIISNQSSYNFDLLMTPNCSNEFNLSIEDNNGRVIWDTTYLRSDIDQSADTDFHRIYGEKYFVFRLPLYPKRSIINDPEKFFIIKINSIDENQLACKTYISPKVIFTKCPE